MPNERPMSDWVAASRKKLELRHRAEMEALERRLALLKEQHSRQPGMAGAALCHFEVEIQEQRFRHEVERRRHEAAIEATLATYARWTSAASAVRGISPSVLAPVSRPDAFAALKRYEAKANLTFPHVPYSTTTITAWRAWRVENRVENHVPGGEPPELRLKSTGYPMFWQPRKRHEAICGRHGRHTAPDWYCHCGIWAFKSVDEMQEVLQEQKYTGPGVLGTVTLWGKVIETEHGFRAQYAYPQELWVDDEMLELGWTYGAPVRWAKDELKTS